MGAAQTREGSVTKIDIEGGTTCID